MDDLPFAKREPRFKPQPTSWLARSGAFEPAIVESRPLNRQTISTREVILGTHRNPTLKSPRTKILDSKRDPYLKFRQNVFFDSTMPKTARTILPKTAPGSTRYQNTPWNRSTAWISHADPNTSLAPDPKYLYETSFMSTSVANEAKENRQKHLNATIAAKRERFKHYEEYAHECDIEEMRKRTATQNKIRKNRDEHLAALELRHKTERIKFFE